NKQELLVQLEQQGIRVPDSWRGGICGRCWMRVEEGKGSPVKKNAVAGEGTILASNYVPKTARRLAP
ncbi:2Fe-2S iron-sulfur cluster binding domain-containing protein, partial [Klebsiella pneumoniae]|uniref:2Fe-2S iron-sulfur cluster binding domain-containing protein n=1 Tax=Klebsiella pneumoniae TaxID=573 RepID=UPI002B1BDB2F